MFDLVKVEESQSSYYSALAVEDVGELKVFNSDFIGNRMKTVQGGAISM